MRCFLLGVLAKTTVHTVPYSGGIPLVQVLPNVMLQCSQTSRHTGPHLWRKHRTCVRGDRSPNLLTPTPLLLRKVWLLLQLLFLAKKMSNSNYCLIPA